MFLLLSEDLGEHEREELLSLVQGIDLSLHTYNI